MDRDLIIKAGLIWRIMEGWTAADVIAHRLGAEIPDVIEARAWLEQHGYLVRAASEVSWLYRWSPEREFEHLWAELIPERPCQLSFCQRVKPRGRIRERRPQASAT